MDKQSRKGQVVIVIDARAVCLLFALALALGYVEGVRRRGELETIERGNARIIQLLEAAEITRGQTVGARLE